LGARFEIGVNAVSITQTELGRKDRRDRHMEDAMKIGRHAGNGRFITVQKAKQMKDRAVVETIKRK
jgi:hypothetical protein